LSAASSTSTLVDPYTSPHQPEYPEPPSSEVLALYPLHCQQAVASLITLSFANKVAEWVPTRQIGRGSYGSVFQTSHRSTPGMRALKRVCGAYPNNAYIRYELAVLAKAAKVQRPDIVRAFGFTTHQDGVDIHLEHLVGKVQRGSL
jgi:hypothetical protein